MSVSLGELAVRFGCELRGDPEVRVERVATLANADAHSLTFLANPRYRAQLADTRAGAVVLEPARLRRLRRRCCSAKPVRDLRAHRGAAVSGTAARARRAPHRRRGQRRMIDPSAEIGAYVVIGAGASVGARAFVGPHSSLERSPCRRRGRASGRARHPRPRRAARRARACCIRAS